MIFSPLSVQVTDKRGQQTYVSIERAPDTCPVCHRSIEAKTVTGGFWAEYRRRLQVAFQCVNQKCQSLFIGYYYADNTGPWRLGSVAPIKPAPISVPPEVAIISPDFVMIRQQVAAAESQELDQLVGIGLRKALEFLIKDFAISEHKDKAEEINASFLGGCIDLYIPDEQVKRCAKRAAWLGNDESHYIRKWVDKDVNDLKTLVSLTVNWIHSHVLTNKFVEICPRRVHKPSAGIGSPPSTGSR